MGQGVKRKGTNAQWEKGSEGGDQIKVFSTKDIDKHLVLLLLLTVICDLSVPTLCDKMMCNKFSDFVEM